MASARRAQLQQQFGGGTAAAPRQSAVDLAAEERRNALRAEFGAPSVGGLQPMMGSFQQQQMDLQRQSQMSSFGNGMDLAPDLQVRSKKRASTLMFFKIVRGNTI